MSRAISLPHEHGGYLTLLGATLAGTGLAEARGPALAVGVATLVAFFVRAPIEQLARCRGARRDGLLLVGLLALFALAVLLGGRLFALLPAVAVVAASGLARWARVGRKSWFEAAGMATLGASAGLMAVAGGAPVLTGVGLALVLGAHAGVAVPLVRAEVRPRERPRARRLGALCLLPLGLVAAALAGLGLPLWGLALLPRALHAAARARALPAVASHGGQGGGLRPTTRVGLRETALLGVVVLSVVLLAG